jgi:hypothetical protein
MSGVGSAFRPSIVTTAVTRAAGAASIAKVDASVHVERLRHQFRAGGVDFEMTAVARAGIVRGGRRTVTIAATHRDGLGPGGTLSGSAAIVTCNGTNAGRSIVARMGSDPAVVENDFDAAVAVQPTDDLTARRRMAGRAWQSARWGYGWIDVRGVRSGSRAVLREKARIPRRKCSLSFPVTRHAREDTPRLVVARRAGGGTRGWQRHAGRPRG